MPALWAARASDVSRGMAPASICWLSEPVLVCCSTVILVTFAPATVIATCIGPYWVLSTMPVNVRAAVDCPAPPAPPVAALASALPLVLGRGLADGPAVAGTPGEAARVY